MLSADLLELQRVDTAVDRISHRRAHLPEGQAAVAAKAGVERNRRAIATSVARQRELTDAIEATENAGGDLTRKRERLQGQMRTIISPREAEALQHELDTIAAERNALDDVELEALEEQSTLIDDLLAAHAAEPELDAASALAADALTAVEADLDREVAALTVARSEVVARLEGGVLSDYERRRARHGGVAVAHLEGRRCSGCNLDLSSGELEQVRATPPGEIADCPQCGRILIP